MIFTREDSDPVLVINNISSLSPGRIHRLCNQSGGSEKLKGNVIRSSCLDVFTNLNDILNQLRISVSIAMGKKNVIIFPADLFPYFSEHIRYNAVRRYHCPGNFIVIPQNQRIVLFIRIHGNRSNAAVRIHKRAHLQLIGIN